MYTHQQKVIALKKYEETKSVTATVQALGYPGRETLYRWLNPMDSLRKQKSTFRGLNTPDHPRHPPVNLKLEAIHRCFELGEDVKSIADEIGYSRASIYTWRRRYIQK
ncbi:MAG: IS3 family transposase, partial [Bacteroidia bacterium]|nr:IS3 family transposase [Bacteroidia bacterium]